MFEFSSCVKKVKQLVKKKNTTGHIFLGLSYFLFLFQGNFVCLFEKFKIWDNQPAPVVQKVDSAIHLIIHYPLVNAIIIYLLVSLIFIYWIVIYLVVSAIHFLSDWGQIIIKSSLFVFGTFWM